MVNALTQSSQTDGFCGAPARKTKEGDECVFVNAFRFPAASPSPSPSGSGGALCCVLQPAHDLAARSSSSRLCCRSSVEIVSDGCLEGPAASPEAALPPVPGVSLPPPPPPPPAAPGPPAVADLRLCSFASARLRFSCSSQAQCGCERRARDGGCWLAIVMLPVQHGRERRALPLRPARRAHQDLLGLLDDVHVRRNEVPAVAPSNGISTRCRVKRKEAREPPRRAPPLRAPLQADNRGAVHERPDRARRHRQPEDRRGEQRVGDSDHLWVKVHLRHNDEDREPQPDGEDDREGEEPRPKARHEADLDGDREEDRGEGRFASGEEPGRVVGAAHVRGHLGRQWAAGSGRSGEKADEEKAEEKAGRRQQEAGGPKGGRTQRGGGASGSTECPGEQAADGARAE